MATKPTNPTVHLYLMGGLGNQLFQIFTAISYALTYNLPFQLPYSRKLTDGITRPTYWDTLFKHLKKYTVIPPPQHQLPQYREPFFHYKPLPGPPSHDFTLFGYFQSWKYFDCHTEQIKGLINYEEVIAEVLAEPMCRSYFVDDCSAITIAMHFRLGDYKYKQDYHPVLSLEYYENALRHLLNNIEQTQNEQTEQTKKQINILYFCEAEDHAFVLKNRIQPLELLFCNNPSPTVCSPRFIKVDDTIADWKQLILMSHCHHFIIANSSFSWWAAYLSVFPGKTVYYPSTWFGNKLVSNTKDLCPADWIRV